MGNGRTIVLSSAYFPPVQYFAEIIKSSTVLIERHETYHKQTYRNRCLIYSSNGVLPLSIPVVKGSFHKVAIQDLIIDNSNKWQKEHISALRAAYNSSAFFEYYSDKLLNLLESNYKYLIDLNQELINDLFELLEIDIPTLGTSEFVKEYMEGCLDMRYTISPKVKYEYKPPEYFQVFGLKHGFKANLSILDLIFNMGPESFSYLKSY